MAKICPNCEKENPSAANYCMFCNTQLVNNDQLTEEDKLRKKIAELEEQKELLKQSKELEKHKMEKELLETKKKQEEIQKEIQQQKQILLSQSVLKQNPSSISKTTLYSSGSQPNSILPSPKPIKKKNTNKLILIIILIVLALIIFGGIYYKTIYLPKKIDREAPRYYSLVNLNFRSSKEAGGDYNKIGLIPYGAELITYETDNEWSYVKYKDKNGEEKTGYVSSDYILNKEDFVIINSVFGDEESKKCISTAKCRIAILNYFKEKGYIGKISTDILNDIRPNYSPNNDNQWQIFCRDFKLKPNNVLYPKLNNKNSKYSDFAIIIKNINTNERRLLLFYFDDDETPHLYYEEPVLNSGYIKSITVKYNYYTEQYQIYTQYSE